MACGLIGWFALGLPGAMLLFGLCAAISLALALVASLLMHPPHEGDGGSPPPPGGDDPPEPPWWPEFERDFAAYVARRRSPTG